jgi:hypothetical protein
VSIFREDGDSLIVDVPYMEAYIPEPYFDSGIAREGSGSVETLGIFSIGVLPERGAPATKRTLHDLVVPVTLTLSYDSIDREQDLSLRGEDPEKYAVLGLSSGSVFIKQLNIVQDSESASRFIELLHGGKLPRTVPYRKIIGLYHEAMDANGVDIEVPSITLELIISELYRCQGNSSKPFRMKAGAGGVGELEYAPVSIKTLPSINSTFTGITFEDINQAITTGVRRAREGTPEVESPIEKTIKY